MTKRRTGSLIFAMEGVHNWGGPQTGRLGSPTRQNLHEDVTNRREVTVTEASVERTKRCNWCSYQWRLNHSIWSLLCFPVALLLDIWGYLLMALFAWFWFNVTRASESLTPSPWSLQTEPSGQPFRDDVRHDRSLQMPVSMRKAWRSWLKKSLCSEY